MRIVRASWIALAAGTLMAAPAHAATSLIDGFDSENGGASFLNYNSFANFTVAGKVDLVATPDYGITCAGGSGSCVDLDGTTGPGTLSTKPVSFAGGQFIKVSFEVSGNQRNAGPDNFIFDSLLTGSTSYDFVCGTGFTSCTSGTYASNTFGHYIESYAGNRGFTTYSFMFRPDAAGTLTLSFGTDSADNVGPILDNVRISGVPEPMTWVMMILGIGVIGGAMRRRRPAVSYAF